MASYIRRAMIGSGFWGRKLVMVGMVGLFVLTACGSEPAGSPTPTATVVTPAVAQPTSVMPVPTPQGGRFAREELLTELVRNSIIPAHEVFAASCETLQAAAAQFAAAPTESSLADLQASWWATAENWAGLEHLRFPYTQKVTSQIKSWPVNAQVIEQFVTGDNTPIDEAFVQSVGTTAKGLAAIEYKLFVPGATPEAMVERLTGSPRRLALLLALTADLAQQCTALHALWGAAAEDPLQTLAQSDDPLATFNLLANGLLMAVDEMAHKGLQYPLLGSFSEPIPEAVEARYARHSLPLLISNTRGAQQTFNASFASYLDFLHNQAETESLAGRINQQFDQTIRMLEAVPTDLYTAVSDEPAAVGLAYAEMERLLVLLRVDMVNQMGLTITYSENDLD